MGEDLTLTEGWTWWVRMADLLTDQTEHKKPVMVTYSPIGAKILLVDFLTGSIKIYLLRGETLEELEELKYNAYQDAQKRGKDAEFYDIIE